MEKIINELSILEKRIKIVDSKKWSEEKKENELNILYKRVHELVKKLNDYLDYERSRREVIDTYLSLHIGQ